MRILCYLTLLLLCGCASVQPLAPAKNQTLSWVARTQQLTQISKWTIHGITGIRTGRDAWTATLFWEQDHTDYALHLFGPLGVNRIQLTGTATQVTLSTSAQAPVSAKDPEGLLQQHLGWKLPVSNLRYWIRGIPAPGNNVQLTKDNFNHLQTLCQDGWEIHYLQYSNINGIDLPIRINISHAQIQLRLIIKQWQL